MESLKDWTILDCACGTGNTYIGFQQAGFADSYGTDGSRKMLECARRNCEELGISTPKLVLDPIRWTDHDAFASRFSAGMFDLVVNTANSLCHIPATADYLGHALVNFNRLLRLGG